MKKIPVRKIETSITEPNFTDAFSIRSLNDMLNAKDMVQELHRHDFYYLLALQKAVGYHEIDFKTFDVNDNCIFLMRPGQVHQLKLRAGTTGYLISFKSEFYSIKDRKFKQILKKAAKTNQYHFNDKTFKKIYTGLTNLFVEYNNKKNNYQEAILSNLTIILIELSRQKEQSSSNNDSSIYKQERLDEFIELLEKEVKNHKQVSEFAAALNLSTYQLNAITKEMLGKTCSQLINEHIILEAKRYLLATKNQVNQIADYLGYEDVSYFIRFFKKQTGITPEAFRSDNRESTRHKK